MLTIPILKVGQALTKEVQSEQAEAGEFINSLTGDGLGTEIEFIVAYYQQGRFAATEDGKAYVAFGATIPEAWEPFVGEEWVGQPFADHPDAEERFKAAVNAKDREWGSGPPISTTHNFSGYAIMPAENPEDLENMVPVRLSLKRTDVPAARKMIQLKRMMRLKAFWDTTFKLSTEKKAFGRHQSYVVRATTGRPTTDEERLLAVELAQAVASQRVNDNQADEAEGAAASEAATPEGALGV